MAYSSSSNWFVLLVVMLLLSVMMMMALATKKTYLVHMKQNASSSMYSATLSNSDSLLYAYTIAYNGFSASLDPQQVHALRTSDSVIGVYQDTKYSLHTTRTPHFLGLQTHSFLWEDLYQASHDVIIGVLDTGVWPESQSFHDYQMPQIPTRWRGHCESTPDFDSSSLCNNKLIGARTFSKGYHMASGKGSYMRHKATDPDSPRDRDGHGTHTATTAAGSSVPNATLFGYATGTARGMAPQARIAAYKVCWTDGCYASDILAGMDQAILDGVDVLSLSFGGSSSSPYHSDAVSIGAFAAVERGIFVACSAGNTGPRRGSLSNVAPWVMTVGAGTLDRDFPAYATLGNGKRYAGVSLCSGEGMGEEPVGLVYFSNSSRSICMAGSLDPEKVRGKVVICDRGVNSRVEKGSVVRDAGGVGMILGNTAGSGEGVMAECHLLPAVAVGKSAGDEIRDYALLDPNPTAVLSFGGTVLNVRPSPVVAAFSSRGPNGVTPQILKPDVIGPGVNILAGWSGAVGPSGSQDTRKTHFNILSGTSMSCPHISGVGALMKAAHPNWSPSAIKSALMTTAYTHDNTDSPLTDGVGELMISTPWAYGSGHVNPQKALSPGLVYDANTQDYIAFLCSLDYSFHQLQLIVKRPHVNCSAIRFDDPGELNYPSFSVVFGNKKSSLVAQYTRTLTNVGEAGSVYDVAVTGPSSVEITVHPNSLLFEQVGEKQTYTVTFVSNNNKGGDHSEFGSITWSNQRYQVRSPVAFTWIDS